MLVLCSDVDAALCVLATGDSELSDPAVQIYFKLIEAFCIEYGVHLLKVSCSAHVKSVLLLMVASHAAGRQQFAACKMDEAVEREKSSTTRLCFDHGTCAGAAPLCTHICLCLCPYMVILQGDKYSKALAILRSYCMQEGGFVSKSSLRLRERVEAESEIGVGNSCVE